MALLSREQQEGRGGESVRVSPEQLCWPLVAPCLPSRLESALWLATPGPGTEPVPAHPYLCAHHFSKVTRTFFLSSQQNPLPQVCSCFCWGWVRGGSEATGRPRKRLLGRPGCCPRAQAQSSLMGALGNGFCSRTLRSRRIFSVFGSPGGPRAAPGTSSLGPGGTRAFPAPPGLCGGHPCVLLLVAVPWGCPSVHGLSLCSWQRGTGLARRPRSYLQGSSRVEFGR